MCKRDIYEVHTEHRGVDIFAALRQNRTRVKCRATCRGPPRRLVGETDKTHHRAGPRTRTGPVVVQFTTEACALCPDATLKI